MRIDTKPYKGSRDFYPPDMRVRNYIFSVWKDVCKSYGYEEYDGPFIESFDLYAAKTGEEIVNSQLYTFEDRGGRRVAIRPEMTPTLARMVAAKFKTLPHPVRWFSMPNLWRYEKPQRGRLREHFQLNVDIFGVDGVEADFEVISIAVDIMKKFGAREEMFEIRVGNRRFIEDVYKSFGINTTEGIRISKAIDKVNKIDTREFVALLKGDAGITDEQVKQIQDFLKDPESKIKELHGTSKGAGEIKELLRLAEENGKGGFIKYDPTIMRGFDYYTGNVFEQFDLSSENKRSMYGGGRYDDLIELFIPKKLSGVGFGFGDVTLINFLESWGLMPKFLSKTKYFVTIWPGEEIAYKKASYEVAAALRGLNINVEMWLESDTKISKQLKYADRKGIKHVILIGEEEVGNGTITVKNMNDGGQRTLELAEFISSLK